MRKETSVPPFTLHDEMLSSVVEISELLGRITVEQKDILSPELRKANRIRSIHSSLAIENNTLSLSQVTDVINGKKVLGNPNEIREVKNAYRAYELLLELNPLHQEDLLRAHRLMMQDLVCENGQFRTGGVGVFAGEKCIHLAPPAHLVQGQIQDLMNWYQNSTLPVLIKSCIFHYEFEFIHPFADGNGRMGRMWHTLFLARWKPIFYWLPIEEMVKRKQSEYYDALAISDAQADSAPFVEMMLKIILETLKQHQNVASGEKSSKKSSEKKPLSDNQRKLLEAIRLNAFITISELVSATGLSNSGVRKILKGLQLAGLLRRIGPDKGGHWEAVPQGEPDHQMATVSKNFKEMGI